MPARVSANNLFQDPLMPGLLTMLVFGLVWAIVGASGLTSTSPGPVFFGLVAVAVAAAGVVLAISLKLRFGPTSRMGLPRRLSAKALSGFVWVNIGQAVAILAAVLVLNKAGALVLIPALTCLVVGLHFFPLARFFGQPQYWWTGAFLVLVAAGGCIAFASGLSGGAIRSVVGFPAAIVLWCTVLHVAKYG